MRKKNPDYFNRIIEFVNEYHKKNDKSPSTTEIADGLGLWRGTVYSYLVRMKEMNMIEYDGKTIKTGDSSIYDHSTVNVPLFSANGEVSADISGLALERYIDMPESLFGLDDLFLVRMHGNKMNAADINDGDILIVSKCKEIAIDSLVLAIAECGMIVRRIEKKIEDKFLLTAESGSGEDEEFLVAVEAIKGTVSHVIKKLK